MFSQLNKYNTIVVSGPQRSGTTIASRMIANDTGFSHIDERYFDIWNKDEWYRLILDSSNSVIHCPAMSINLDMLFDVPNTLVVFMLRDIDDIVASQKRIGWSDRSTRKSYNVNRADTRPISVIKYAHWITTMHRLPNVIELEYESLKKHHLWVDKSKRQNFDRRQWK